MGAKPVALAAIYLQYLDQKRPAVGDLFDELAGWLAQAMAGPGFDADQCRAGPA
jgi:hypothetical protein